jgi:hypothetical protein
VIGIDIGKNSFHMVGLDDRGTPFESCHSDKGKTY